jgi:chromosome segregation protein
VSRQAAAEAQTRQLSNDLAQRQAHVTQLLERGQTLLAEQDTRSTEVAGLLKQQQELQEKQVQLTASLTDFSGELLVLETQQDQKRDSLTELNQMVEQLKGQLAALNRQEDALRARQDVLDKLRSDMSGYFAGVRTVLQPESGLAGVIGPLSQLIQVPPDLEVALETALGGRWQDVVVETFANANAAITHLKENRAGRATFLPLDTIRVGRAAKAPDTPGVIGLASTLVTITEERLRPITEFTLNRTVVVADLPAARRAFAVMQGNFQIVTREGELMRSGGAVTGGRREGKRAQEGTFLAREREWRELPAQIAEVVKKHEAISSQLADNHEQSVTVKKERQVLVDQYQQKDQRRREIQSVADKTDRTLEQLAASIVWQQDLLTKVKAELEQIDERQVVTEAEIVQLTRARQEAEGQVRQLAKEAQALSAHNLLTEESQARNKVETISARQKSQQALLESHQVTRQQLVAQIESKQARADSLATEREALLVKRQELQSRSGQFESQLGKFTGKIQDSEKQLTELEARQLQLEHDAATA